MSNWIDTKTGRHKGILDYEDILSRLREYEERVLKTDKLSDIVDGESLEKYLIHTGAVKKGGGSDLKDYLKHTHSYKELKQINLEKKRETKDNLMELSRAISLAKQRKKLQYTTSKKFAKSRKIIYRGRDIIGRRLTIDYTSGKGKIVKSFGKKGFKKK